MNNEYLISVAREINNQILWSINISEYFSWGVSKKQCGMYKDMPTLMLLVNGFVHKGWVYISLNEGKDAYEVRLMNKQRKEVKLIDEVYCDNLGRVIDANVERPLSVSDEEYSEMVLKAQY